MTPCACTVGPQPGGSESSTGGSTSSTDGSTSSTGGSTSSTGGSEPCNTEPTGTTEPAACGSAFPGKPHDGFAADDAFVITVRIEAAAPVSLSCSSRLNLVLYGLDKSIADLPATVVRSHVGTIDALPLEFDLQVPANPHDVIPATLEDARFYFAVKIDADGNGQICPGDYDLDYDLTGGPLYVTFPVTETIVVPVAML